MPVILGFFTSDVMWELSYTAIYGASEVTTKLSKI